jgi:hypothetical protein
MAASTSTVQDRLILRLTEIINAGIGYITSVEDRRPGETADARLRGLFNSAGRALLNEMYSPEHPHTIAFSINDQSWSAEDFEYRLGILDAVNLELRGQWYQSTRGLIAGELFDDFLEMAKHLFEEGYKDAAAVIAGSSLESHLRRLGLARGVDIHDKKGEPRSASNLNIDLRLKNVYILSEEKQITAWLGIRNDAAHGHYNKVDAGRVGIMIEGIRSFIVRFPA